MRILQFGFDVQMVLEVLWLPEIPGGDEDFAFGFEVFLNLVKNKKLIIKSGKVMENGDAKDVVVSGKMLPDLLFGNVGFTEFVVWMRFFCLI